jgi:hypothetical protein
MIRIKITLHFVDIAHLILKEVDTSRLSSVSDCIHKSCCNAFMKALQLSGYHLSFHTNSLGFLSKELSLSLLLDIVMDSLKSKTP